jgi:hypothetical protein
MKQILSLFLLSTAICLCQTSSAQGPFEFKATFIKKDVAPAKTIVVLANDVDPNLEKANAWLEEAVRKFWTATRPEFTSKKLSEVKTGTGEAIFIAITSGYTQDLINRKASDKSPAPVYKDGEFGWKITFLYRDKKGNLVSDVSTPYTTLYHGFDQLDVITSVRILNSYFDEVIRGVDDKKMRALANGIPPLYYKLTANHKTELKSKTLLIDKDMLAKKTTEEDLKGSYTGKLKIASREEILGYVQSGSKDYAYTFSIGVEDGSSMSGSLILDTKNGHVLSYAKNSSMVVNTSRFDPVKVDKKTVKAYEDNLK